MIVPLDTAAAICEVRPATIRQWVNRGNITRHSDGYETEELLRWLDTRNQKMADGALAATTARMASYYGD